MFDSKELRDTFFLMVRRTWCSRAIHHLDFNFFYVSWIMHKELEPRLLRKEENEIKYEKYVSLNWAAALIQLVLIEEPEKAEG